MATSTGVNQVVGSVVLAVLAQPIHEFGHAVALRASTGVWPQIGVLSVQPLVPVGSKAAALLVVSAGDLGVLAWWTLIFVWMRRRSQREWAIVGTTSVLFVVLLEWMAAAVMFPFGRANLGGSDAAKFLDITGFHPVIAAAAVSVAVALVGVGVAFVLFRCNVAFRRGRSPRSLGRIYPPL